MAAPNPEMSAQNRAMRALPWVAGLGDFLSLVMIASAAHLPGNADGPVTAAPVAADWHW